MGAAQQGTFAELLSSAIRGSGLTLEGLRQRLAQEDVGISVATLSHWQNGRSQPTSAHAVHTLAAMERILQVPVGSLVKAAPVAPTRSGGAIASRTAFPLPHDVRRAMALSGMDAAELRKVSSHLTVTVAPDRSQGSEVVRTVVQSLVAGARSFPVVTELDEQVDSEVTGLTGCTVDDEVRLAAEGLRLTRMVLPRPLRQGELAMVEYMTTFEPCEEPMTGFGIATPRLSELVMEVQFPWGDLPRRVLAEVRDPAAGDDLLDPETAEELPLAGGSAQMVRLDLPPSVAVLEWEW